MRTASTRPRTGLDDLLTAVLFLLAFALGWTALAETANETGLFPAVYGGYAWALVVDGFIWLGARTYRGHDGRWNWYGCLMFAVGIAASVGFQAYHAWTLPDATVSQRVLVAVALVPPLALAMSAEAWRRRRSVDAAMDTPSTSLVDSPSTPPPSTTPDPSPPRPQQPVPVPAPVDTRPVPTVQPAPSTNGRHPVPALSTTPDTRPEQDGQPVHAVSTGTVHPLPGRSRPRAVPDLPAPSTDVVDTDPSTGPRPQVVLDDLLARDVDGARGMGVRELARLASTHARRPVAPSSAAAALKRAGLPDDDVDQADTASS